MFLWNASSGSGRLCSWRSWLPDDHRSTGTSGCRGKRLRAEHRGKPALSQLALLQTVAEYKELVLGLSQNPRSAPGAPSLWLLIRSPGCARARCAENCPQPQQRERAPGFSPAERERARIALPHAGPAARAQAFASKVGINLINLVLIMESRNVPRTLFLLLDLPHGTVSTGFCFFLSHGQSQPPRYVEIC